ncbi:hypothetical protein Tco_1163510 [Tanacetum coccineum]
MLARDMDSEWIDLGVGGRICMYLLCYFRFSLRAYGRDRMKMLKYGLKSREIIGEAFADDGQDVCLDTVSIWIDERDKIEDRESSCDGVVVLSDMGWDFREMVFTRGSIAGDVVSTRGSLMRVGFDAVYGILVDDGTVLKVWMERCDGDVWYVLVGGIQSHKLYTGLVYWRILIIAEFRRYDVYIILGFVNVKRE